MRKLIREYIPQANEHCQNQFVRYYELLIDYNNRMNLTAITDPFGIVQRHFADSLLGEKLIPNGSKCIDVGTGAGFPGIPLLIMRPDIELTLLDSLNKRVAFLNDVVAELSLPGAAEELKAAESALKCLNGTAEIREIDTEWGARSLVLIKKHGTMPKKYPRRPGVAAKNPL